MTRKIFWSLVFGSMLLGTVLIIFSKCSSSSHDKKVVKTTQTIIVSDRYQATIDYLNFKISSLQKASDDFWDLKKKCWDSFKNGEFTKKQAKEIIKNYNEEIKIIISDKKKVVNSRNLIQNAQTMAQK